MIVYPFLNMDALTQYRKTKLKTLIEGKPYEGNQAEFGRRAGVTKARITQLLDENESFGERAAQSLCDKLELSARYFEDGFVAIAENRETTQPSNTTPTLADTLAQLGQVIAASDKLTRAQIKPILDQLLETPEQAAELGQRLQATIAIQQSPAPPTPVADKVLAAKPITRTVDFIKKAAEEK